MINYKYDKKISHKGDYDNDTIRNENSWIVYAWKWIKFNRNA